MFSNQIIISLYSSQIGISREDMVSEVKKRVDVGDIPAPSKIVLSSNIKLVYSLKEVEINLSTIQIHKSIARILVELLSDLVGEGEVNDIPQVFYISESDCVIEASGDYDSAGLYEILTKLTEQQSSNQEFVVESSLYKLLSVRVSDLEVLWRYRGNQKRKIKGYDNDFIYIYSYHLSFFIENYFELEQRVKWLFKRAEITLEIEFENTVKQAFYDCSQFKNWFETNNYVMKYAEDRIIRPHRSMTIVKLLNISKREESKLESIISENTKYERKKVREAERLFQKRRNGGTRSRENVLYTKRLERRKLRLEALNMLNKGVSKKTIAEVLNVSRPTLYKVLSETEE